MFKSSVDRFALGIDRIVALFVGVASIRDVIAFPKTQRGACLATGAPAKAGKGQLDELRLKVLRPTSTPTENE